VKRKTNRQRLDHYYQKWVTEATDAVYYGTADEAVEDIKLIFCLFEKELLREKKKQTKNSR
jgi:hypothetical protein